tara:strand:- start:402 stop:698 length:297 start_codon:yes stop_codon:yes gene_type:complete
MNYEFLEKEQYKGRVPIQITEDDSKYGGLKFIYGTIKFVEVGDDEENMGLNFGYEILENPNNVDEDQELVDTMGDILVDVLESEMGQVGSGEDFLRED